MKIVDGRYTVTDEDDDVVFVEPAYSANPDHVAFIGTDHGSAWLTKKQAERFAKQLIQLAGGAK